MPSRLVLYLTLAANLAGCTAARLGPEGPWVSGSEVAGPLRPEVSATAPYASPSPDHADFDRPLRVVTFNVHCAENVGEIIVALRAHPALAVADVIFLQEVQGYPDEGESRSARIARGLGMAYAYAPARIYRNGDRTGTHGNAILSRLDLEKVEVMELPRGKLVVNEERRVALAAEIRLAQTPVRLVNVHLDTRLNPKARFRQLQPVLRDASGPVIVAGDFNSNPVAWAFQLIPFAPVNQAVALDEDVRELGFETPTSGFGHTAPFPLLRPRLDSVFIRGLSARGGAVERSVSVSDHWPLWLDVELRDADS